MFAGKLYAQEALSSFLVFETKGKAYLNFVISVGNTCNGIDILRATDTIDYKLIGHIGGVCGSITEPIAYSFIDENPIKNTKIYYKLNMGNLGFSNPVSIEIVDTQNEGFLLRPNPANELTELNFENPTNTEFTVNLINQHGKLVYSQSTNLNKVNINVSNLPTGIYTFILNNPTIKPVSGKLVVHH